ncbi:MAG: ROK family transcriptional regulator [Propionibacteriaceae bacterium]|nr:ROK family transcriptional regulator [Propionibacteriaceae bacterium]
MAGSADGPRGTLIGRRRTDEKEAEVAMLATARGSGGGQPRARRATDRASQESLREHNLAVVLAAIMAAEPDRPPSRADLAEHIGLTKGTVSALVNQLLALGLVAERAPERPRGVGRPAVPLAPAAKTVVGLGLEVNVDYVGLRAVDLTGAVVAESVERSDLRGSDPESVLGALFRQARAAMAALEADGIRVVGSGLALPGLADHPQGPLRLAPNLGWVEADIRAIAAAAAADPDPRWPAPTPARTAALVTHLTVDNEANFAARAELLRRGGADDRRFFIYLSGAIGVGAALVIDGEVFGGGHGWAGEIGHTIVDPAGPLCACGARGCLEQYAGKQAILRAAGLPLDAGLDDLLDALAADPDADTPGQAAIATAARALGIALASAVNLVDIAETVIGGDLTPLTGRLAPGILAELRGRVVAARWIRQDLVVRPAEADPRPALTGAAWHALTRVVADPAALLNDRRPEQPA